MKSKRTLAIIFALLLVGSALNSCGKKNESEDAGEYSEPVYNTVPEQETPAKVNTEEQPEEIPEEAPVEEKIINKLTGIETTEVLSNQRPVAIMFNNLKAALPQHGIGEMDVVYEAIVEGSITRLLGIATDWESLPTLGSIRSSRDYYIDFCDAHNGIYVHAGGSNIAYQTIWERGTDSIDGTNGPQVSSNAFYRNQERRNKGVSLEHTLFSSGERLTKAIQGNGFTTTLKDGYIAPFKFSDNASEFDGAAANYVYIPFSNYAQSYFDYNEATGIYDKGQYVSSKSSLDKHDSPHIDGNTNEQLTFKNILIIYTSYRTIDEKGRQAVDFTGKGNGYYFTEGKCKEIRWERPTRTGGYTLYEADGTTELQMTPGKTYVGVVKNGTEIIYK